MADLLVSPSSDAVLRLMREARKGSASSMMAGEVERAQSLAPLIADCSELYRAALSLESDPEIVSRNTIARLLGSLSPFLLSVQDIRSLKDKGPLEVLMTFMTTAAEFASASQYLASSQLATEAHFRENLLEVEERFMDMAQTSDDGTLEAIEAVESFMDSVRSMDVPAEVKPFIPFLLWTLIVVLDYRICK